IPYSGVKSPGYRVEKESTGVKSVLYSLEDNRCGGVLHRHFRDLGGFTSNNTGCVLVSENTTYDFPSSDPTIFTDTGFPSADTQASRPEIAPKADGGTTHALIAVSSSSFPFREPDFLSCSVLFCSPIIPCEDSPPCASVLR